LLPRRRQLRRFYFGDLGPGESTKRFLAAVSDVVAQRDQLLAQLPPHQVHAAGAAAATGDMGAEEDEARFAAENALGAADEALSAAEDALAAAKGAVTSAREPGAEADPQAAHHEEAPVPAAPMATPTSGGIQIR
jgi:hypothetical protein